MEAVPTENTGSLASFDWDFKDSNKSHGIHSIHSYPAKFIPEIPRALMEKLGVPKGTAILDPFCGSGVTLVEAQNVGVESWGVDLNPIACLISRVKTQPFPNNGLAVGLDVVEKAKKRIGLTPIPDIPNLNHWFKMEVQDALAPLIDEIHQVTQEDMKNVLLLCVSSIIVKVSNQDSDTRYAAVENVITSDNVFDFFIEALRKAEKYTNGVGKEKKAHVLQRNILELSTTEIETPIGLVVTSPPYPNAYEYWLYHKYRMWWLGFDPIDVKNNEIGARAHYFKKNHQTVEDFEAQMDNIFDTLSKLVVPGGHVAMVTGNSKIHGKIIDNEHIIANAGQTNRFKLVEIVTRKMSMSRKAFNLSHARIKKEHIVILEKE